jgi:hypothetical protein
VSNGVQDPRVQGLVLVDPVDNSSFGPQGVGEHLLSAAAEELFRCWSALLCPSRAFGQYPANIASGQPAKPNNWVNVLQVDTFTAERYCPFSDDPTCDMQLCM